MQRQREGILLVISAPSGAGKTSVCQRLIDIFPTLRHSVSYTTRPRRDGEVDGRDYHFVDAETFRRMVAAGQFAEWAQVHGNAYGTSLATLNEARDLGLDLLLDIDVQGANQLRRRVDGAVFVFLLPPDLQELERRLNLRGQDAAEVIEQRLRNAREEIAAAGLYDYWVVNRDLEQAVQEVAAIVRAESCRVKRQRWSPTGWIEQQNHRD